MQMEIQREETSTPMEIVASVVLFRQEVYPARTQSHTIPVFFFCSAAHQGAPLKHLQTSLSHFNTGFEGQRNIFCSFMPHTDFSDQFRDSSQ